jgi:hypothetical protein
MHAGAAHALKQRGCALSEYKLVRAGEEQRVEADWEVEGAGEDAEAVSGAEEHSVVGPAGAGDPALGGCRPRLVSARWLMPQSGSLEIHPPD